MSSNANRILISRRSYLKNREKVISRSRERYLANKEAILEQHRAWKEKNKEVSAAQQLEYRKANRAKINLRNREFYFNNRERCLARSAEHYQKNRTKRLAQAILIKKNRRKIDPGFRILEALRVRARRAIFAQGDKKKNRTLALLGAEIYTVRQHLEAAFQPGMSWENYGEWHIDHKRPCASFDLTDPAQQRECFHYLNLQPLWKIDNLKKGARLWR